MSLEITVSSSKTLEKLEEMTKNIESSKEVIEQLSNEMADYIIHQAKIDCPVDTGVLQESIRWEGRFPAYEFKADAKDKAGYSYGISVEYGDVNQRPQPFLNPAIQTGIKDYSIIIKEELHRYIMKK